MTVCRGIRGATVSEANTAEAIYTATRELLTELVEANNIEERDVAAVYFTTTPDLNAGFPAAAARQMGWNQTALMGSMEVDVPGSLPSCIRILILINTELEPEELVNLYLRGTEVLKLAGVESTSKESSRERTQNTYQPVRRLKKLRLTWSVHSNSPVARSSLVCTILVESGSAPSYVAYGPKTTQLKSNGGGSSA